MLCSDLTLYKLTKNTKEETLDEENFIGSVITRCNDGCIRR